MHHGARLFVAGVCISDGQVLERQLHGLQGIGVGIGRSQNRDPRFQGVSQTVDTGVGGKAFRHRHDELRIDDRHIRTQRVVGQSHLAPSRFVEQDGERSDFAPGAAGSGNGDQPCVVNFFGRILNYAFAQIQERRCQFFQVRLRRFVFQLHDLRRIDDRAAAQRDDLVRFVEIERLHPLHHDLDFRLSIRNDRDMDLSSGGM